MFRSGTDLDMTVKLFTLLHILFRFPGSEMLIHICFSLVEIVSFTMTDMNWYHPDMVGGHWNWSTSRPGMLDDLSVKYRQCPSSTKLLALEWLVSVDTKAHRINLWTDKTLLRYKSIYILEMSLLPLCLGSSVRMKTHFPNPPRGVWYLVGTVSTKKIDPWKKNPASRTRAPQCTKTCYGHYISYIKTTF